MAIPKSKDALDKQFFSIVNGQQKQVFEEIFKKYFKPLCEYAKKLLNDELLVEDIVTEVFMKFLHLPHDFELTETQKVYKWLMINTRSRCFDMLRHKKKFIVSIPPFEDLSLADKAEIEAELSSLIYEELDKLPPKRKQIMIQLYMKGYTSKQVAQQMKLSRQTVINQRVKALKVLRSNLKRLFSLM
jgi:RNA polymerase sigma factor (sigma-70 family)